MMYAPTRPLRPDDGVDESPAERAARRRRLHSLDRCLDLLETAMERNRPVVDSRDAAILARTTLMLHEGMPVANAIDVVLLLQEAYMRPLRQPAWARAARGPVRIR